MVTNLIFHKEEHAGQRTLFMLLNVLAAPPSDIPVAGSGHNHYTSSGVYQILLTVL